MLKDATIKRHFRFFWSVVLFYFIYSVILDEIFYTMDKARGVSFLYSIRWYLGLAVILNFFWIPLIFLYNRISEKGFDHLKQRSVVRVCFGLVIGLLIGCIVEKNGLSLYIGKLRPLRNLMLFGLIGVSVEIMRIIVSRRSRRFEYSADNPDLNLATAQRRNDRKI